MLLPENVPSKELLPEVYSALLSGLLSEVNPDMPEKALLSGPGLVFLEEPCLAKVKITLKKEDMKKEDTGKTTAENPVTTENAAINIKNPIMRKKRYITKKWIEKIPLKAVCLLSIISLLGSGISPAAEGQTISENSEQSFPQTTEKNGTVQQELNKESEKQTSVIEDAKNLLFYRLFRDFKYVITLPKRLDKSYLLPIIGVGTLIGGLMAVDQDVRKYTMSHHNQKTNDFFSKYIDPLGDGRYGAAICGVFYVGGKIFNNDRAKETAIMGIESMAVAGALSSLGKFLIGRQRPNKNKGAFSYTGVDSRSYKSSLPSGHTTMAFSLASVIAEQYENIAVNILVYGAASAVGFQRVYDDKHWLSDVAAGAVLGTVVGKTIVKLNRADFPVKVKPVIDPETKTIGLALNLGF